jgi:DNA-binding transcriptional ArsR family regulator
MDLLNTFKALANENRQKILFEVLSDKEIHSVKSISDRMNLAMSTTSEHLSIMKRAGLVVSEKKDKEVFYSIKKETFEDILSYLKNWLDCC